MIHMVDHLLALALLSVLSAFGSSRLPVLIKAVGFQGVVVSVAPLFMGYELSGTSMVFTLLTLGIRGIGMPLCIHLVIQKVAIHRDAGATIGYHASLMIGLVLIVGSIFVSPKFNAPRIGGHILLIPAAITLLGTGMFLLMARRNAIAMVLGYIVLENGIYLVGTCFSVRAHHIVEFGILLDVLAGVMIMAVILQHITRTFHDVDTVLLRTLKE